MLAGCGNEARSQEAQLPYAARFVLGVQTHFGQNWPAQRLDLAQRLPAGHLRDGISWAAAETEPGRIVLPEERLRIFRDACRAGIRLTMTVIPRNPIYEQNNVVATDHGRAAFLAYLKALLDALPGCIEALEIGNEINGSGALPVAGGLNGPETYVQLMRALYAPLKRKAPELVILGGSSNAIATGFLERLFALGLLDHVDAIAVHPYRDHGEGLHWEVRHLAETMARHGKRVPVWATEFSDNFDQPGLAAPALVKTVTLLGAAGIEKAMWYALSDQQWFRHMGLFTSAGESKPAAEAFAFVQRELLSRGRPLSASDSPLLQLYRFGPDRWVAWGTPRDVALAAGAAAFTATGDRIAGPVRIGAEPIILSGSRPSFGATPILADSLLQFGSAPWSYHVRAGRGTERALTPLDGQFASVLGDRYSRPLFANEVGGAVAGTRERPQSLILRYTAAEAMRASLLACVYPNASGDGLVVAIEHNGRELLSREVRTHDRLALAGFDLKAGERVSLAFSPAGVSGRGNSFRYRIRLVEPDAEEPPCPAHAAGWSDA